MSKKIKLGSLLARNVEPRWRPYDHLATWLQDSRIDHYLGRAAVIKLDVCAHMATREGSLADIARRHGVSKAALTQHMRRYREIFGCKEG